MLNTRAVRSDKKQQGGNYNGTSEAVHPNKNLVMQDVSEVSNGVHNVYMKNATSIQSQVQPHSTHNEQAIFNSKGGNPIPQPTKNIINVSNVNVSDKDAMLLEYNYSDKRFLFHDKNKTFLGSFTANELLKYVVSQAIPNFMEGTSYVSAKEILEKYICTIENDKIRGPTMKIMNHLESPFTGHVEMLIKLYKNIEEFEKNNLPNEIAKLAECDREKAERIFKDFTYTLLNHTLKIIAILSEMIKSENNPELKKTLLKYSVAIMYKLSAGIRGGMDGKLAELDKVMKEKSKVESIKETLGEKVLELEQNVLQQSEQIRQLGGMLRGGGSLTTEESTTEAGNNVSSTPDIENIIGDVSVSTSLSNLLTTNTTDTETELISSLSEKQPKQAGGKSKSRKIKDNQYSSSSTFQSSNYYRTLTSDNTTSGKEKENDFDYLTSNNTDEDQEKVYDI